MNPIELIQNHFEEFTKSEKEIAIYIYHQQSTKNFPF